MPEPWEYKVAWISTRPTDYVAVRAFLDEKHDPPTRDPYDNNEYMVGRVGLHNVVIPILPNRMHGDLMDRPGIVQMLRTFPNIRFALLVGPGSGAPTEEHDVRLGDVVVGSHGICHLDLGKFFLESKRPLEQYQEPPTELMVAVASILRTPGMIHDCYHEGLGLQASIDRAVETLGDHLKLDFSRPSATNDRLYKPHVTHMASDDDCGTACGNGQEALEEQEPRGPERGNTPAIHYGRIAILNRVLHDARVRDLRAKETGSICFYTEENALMDEFPFIAICGICDYADSHRDRKWLGFASMAAAAYAKELLFRIPVEGTSVLDSPHAELNPHGLENPADMELMVSEHVEHGRLDEAEEMQEKVVEMHKAAKDQEHLHTSPFDRTDDMEPTDALDSRLYETDDIPFERVLPPQDPQTMRNMTDMAIKLMESGNVARAMSTLAACVEMCERHYGVEDAEYKSARGLLELWRSTESEPSWSESQSVFSKDPKRHEGALTEPTAESIQEPVGESSARQPPKTFYEYGPEMEPMDDDYASVVSENDDIQSLAGTHPDVAELREPAVRYMIYLLTQDVELHGLFCEATRRVSEAKFVANNRRLLRRLFKDLRPNAVNESQAAALEVLRSRALRQRISKGIHEAVGPSSSDRKSVTANLARNKDDDFLLNRFLGKADWPPPVLPSADDRGGESSGDESSTTSEERESGIPDLEAAAHFMTSGEPLQTYKDSIRAFIQPIPKRAESIKDPSAEPLFEKLAREEDDISQHSSEASRARYDERCPVTGKAFSYTFPELVDALFDALLPAYEPPVPPGRTRIRWTCTCGDNLFEDLVEHEPGSLAELQAHLREMSPQDSSGHLGKMTLGNLLHYILFPVVYTWTKRGTKPTRTNGHGEDGALPSITAAPETPPNPCPNGKKLKLLLCIDKAEDETRLYQEELEDVSQDASLFQFLRDKYWEHRWLKSWMTLRTVRKVSVTRFDADANSFACIYDNDRQCEARCVCLPPRELVSNGEYACSPRPENMQPGRTQCPPEILPRLLTHYFRKPHAFRLPQDRIYNQMPKHAGHELRASSSEIVEGWGLHFEEGWHWRSVYVFVFVVVVVGGITFGIVWTVRETDMQSAFGVTSCWLATAGLLLGYIAVRDI